MTDLIDRLLPLLENHRLPGLDAGPAAFYPYYDGYSLANVPSSICHWLGVPAFGSPALGAELLDGWNRTFRHVVLVVADGLGLDILQRAMAAEGEAGTRGPWTQLLPDARLGALTSVVPSTTAAALTTLWTGVTPARHGVVGYQVWLKEYGMIANLILHNPASYSMGEAGTLRQAGFLPETFLPVPTLGPHLLQNGVTSFALQPSSIIRSGLSVMLAQQAETVPYRTQADLWVTLDTLLETHREERTFTYAYWPDLDTLSHRFGPGDRRIDLELANFSRLMEYFVQSQRKHSRGDTLIVLLADHGQILTPHNPAFELHNHPEMMNRLVMTPSGEMRLSYLFTHGGQDKALVEYVDQTWPGLFRMLPSELAMRCGLMGQNGQHPRLADRLGDWIAVSQEDAYWWWDTKENMMLGRHGGMSRQEMLVPFFAMAI